MLFASEEHAAYDPPKWITTDQLDAELYNAVMEDSSAFSDNEDGAFAEIDEYFEEDDDCEDEVEERRSILWLLGQMRHHLAELLGRPPAK
ncbi:MAG: hypothetical protein ABSD59_24000 [Terracidiphilus sp.]